MPDKQRNSKHERFGYKHEDSGQRKKRLFRFAIVIVSVIVIAALGLGGWYFYNSQVKTLNQAAIRVNGVTHDLRYYTNMLKTLYGNVSSEILGDYSDYGEQDIEKLAGYAEQLIVHNEIIQQGSSAFGVQIPRDVIRDKLEEDRIPVTDEHIDISMAQELVEKQVPSIQPQAHVQAILLENESVAHQAITRLQAGEVFEQVANSLSKIPDFKIINGDLGWVTAREADLNAGSSKLGDVILEANTGVLGDVLYDDNVTKQFGYWVIKVIEKNDATETNAATIHTQGILVGSEQAANDVIDELNAGADIDELAKQLSELPGAAENGAEMGWMTEGEVDSSFDVLFDMPLDEISMPIGNNQAQTKGGYWVYNVLEKDETRALTTAQKNKLVGDFFERCSAELEKDPNYKVEILLTEEMRLLAINEAVLAQGEGSVITRTSSLTIGEVGISYFCQLEVYGNQKGNTWSITAGDLVNGLSLDSHTGVISGIPNMAGVHSVTIEVNSGLHYWTQDMVLRVLIPVSVITKSLPDAQVGTYYSVTLEALADTFTYTWSITSGNLPDGLSLDAATGNIYGTPTTGGTYEFTVQVDDSLAKATKALSLSVGSP
jgi:hypothetical protein